MGYKVGEIVRFNDEGVEGIGILYEVGNKGPFNFRAQDATGAKHKELVEENISPATAEEIKQFKEAAGPELTREAVLEREAAEVQMTVAEFENWVDERVKYLEATFKEQMEESQHGVGADEGPEEDD